MHPISLEGLDQIGVRKDGALFWDGKQIEVARTFSLTWWQKAGAVVALACGVVQTVVSVAGYWWPWV